MKRLTCIGFAVLVLLAGAAERVPAQTQAEPLRNLDAEEARRFLPDRVPMEAYLIAVDTGKFSALQFPDKSRFAVAALQAAGLDAEAQKKYQYVFVSETKVRLDRWNIPAGMVGVALERLAEPNAPTRPMVTRDFSGAELDRLILKLDTAGKEGVLELVPKGSEQFELRIGRYVIGGTQR